MPLSKIIFHCCWLFNVSHKLIWVQNPSSKELGTTYKRLITKQTDTEGGFNVVYLNIDGVYMSRTDNIYDLSAMCLLFSISWGFPRIAIPVGKVWMRRKTTKPIRFKAFVNHSRLTVPSFRCYPFHQNTWLTYPYTHIPIHTYTYCWIEIESNKTNVLNRGTPHNNHLPCCAAETIQIPSEAKCGVKVEWIEVMWCSDGHAVSVFITVSISLPPGG